LNFPEVEEPQPLTLPEQLGLPDEAPGMEAPRTAARPAVAGVPAPPKECEPPGSDQASKPIRTAAPPVAPATPDATSPRPARPPTPACGADVVSAKAPKPALRPEHPLTAIPSPEVAQTRPRPDDSSVEPEIPETPARTPEPTPEPTRASPRDAVEAPPTAAPSRDSNGDRIVVRVHPVVRPADHAAALSAVRVDDDAVDMPAPPPEVFAPRAGRGAQAARRDPLRRAIHWRRTLIPVLLTLGLLMPALGGAWFVLVPDDSIFKLFRRTIPTVLLAVGPVLLILAIVNMIQVRAMIRAARHG
jgi:hypothetical protein